MKLLSSLQLTIFKTKTIITTATQTTPTTTTTTTTSRTPTTTKITPITTTNQTSKYNNSRKHNNRTPTSTAPRPHHATKNSPEAAPAPTARRICSPWKQHPGEHRAHAADRLMRERRRRGGEGETTGRKSYDEDVEERRETRRMKDVDGNEKGGRKRRRKDMGKDEGKGRERKMKGGGGKI